MLPAMSAPSKAVIEVPPTHISDLMKCSSPSTFHVLSGKTVLYASIYFALSSLVSILVSTIFKPSGIAASIIGSLRSLAI
jgi:hypothetical protein